ncbi:MAG: biopolymer transporter ExbD [Arcobacteraceae bacterium]|jgi:biopolymer transport protein ExbD|nr:biopolymer transporter ExbD [Arcobacteraceae bacterium]
MKRREPLTLDLTPLIDVVFILIIFFIVTSSFKKENYALNLTLPQGANSSKVIEKKMVTIELDEKNLAYNGEKIDFIQLQEKLELIKNKQDAITVKIDKSVPYQKVVELLDILQLNNLSNLSLVTTK